jgi:uncharacterized protein
MSLKQYQELKAKVLARMRKELPSHLHYHSPEHTEYVLKTAEVIAASEGIQDEELMLLRIAVLYHDLGFVHTTQNHEVEGCALARQDLPEFGLTTAEIDTVCGMIMATRLPQTPHNVLEEIIADADLEYLGTDNFTEISNGLYRELLHSNPNLTVSDWNRIQVSFLEEHRYFTRYCRENRSQKKALNLKQLRLAA